MDTICPACMNDTLTTHADQGIAVCQGCSPVFCMECYFGARYYCVFFQDTPPVPEYNWECAEAFMILHPEATERVVRSGPQRKCSVVRIDGQLFRRVMFNGIITQENACLNK
jgi:hypothetical protein